MRHLNFLPSLNPSRTGALPSSFGGADVNSLTGRSSKCLIRSEEKNDLFYTSGLIKHPLVCVLRDSWAGFPQKPANVPIMHSIKVKLSRLDYQDASKTPSTSCEGGVTSPDGS